MSDKFVSEEEINNLYSFHPPKNDNIKEAHESVRRMTRNMAHELNRLLAECPQKTHLLRQVLPEVMMRSNQIVAIHGVSDEYRDYYNTNRAQEIGG